MEGGPACGLGKRQSAASSPLAEDFECAVCCDLLLDPVVAPCGHDLCSHCYRRWVQSFGIAASAFCPLCRCSMPSNLAVCLRLQKTIGHLYPEAVDRRRKEVKQQELDADAAERSSPKPSTPTVPQQSLPTYPQGPYPVELVTQWAAAVPLASLVPTMVVATQIMGNLHDGMSGIPAMLSPVHAQSSAVVQGTPVLFQLFESAMHGAMPCWSASMQNGCSMPGSASFAGSTSATTTPCAPPALRQAWQTTADGAERLQLARAIVNALQARGLHLSLGPKLADAVRLLELILYRTAPSKEAYLNVSDLDARIAAAVQQRAAAAAARRARLDTPAAAVSS